MNIVIGTVIVFVFCSKVTAKDPERDLSSPIGWKLQTYSQTLAAASRSKDKINRMNAIQALQDPMTVALLKEETALSVVRASSVDPFPEIRLATLNAIYTGLSKLKIITPTTPLVIKMQNDSSPEVAQYARTILKKLVDRNREYEQNGYSSDDLRRNFFKNGVIPKLY